MNWDAVGALAELLGAIAVIASLVYLASQIRQNTRVQRRANLGDIATDLSASLRSAASAPELGSLVVRAYADLDTLDPVERYRFDCFFYAWLATFERAMLDARDGEYPEELLVPMREAIAGFLGTPGGRAWWKQRKVWFSAFGQGQFESILNDPQTAGRGADPTPAA